MEYLLVTHIPFTRTTDGILVDELWANDLMGLFASIGPIRVAAPEHEFKETWGPTMTTLPVNSGITFIGFPPMRSWFDPLRKCAIRKILRREVAKADLIHSSNPFPPYVDLLYAHDCAVKMGKKTVFVIAEDFCDMLNWEWVRPTKSRLKKWLKEKSVQRLDKKVRHAIEKASLTFLFTPAAVSLYRLDTPHSYAARDVTHLAEDVISSEDFAEKCRLIKQGTPLIITAACRHKPLKGLEFLVQAVAELKKKGIRVEAKLYGHGPQTTELKELSSQLNVADCISFPGALQPGKEVYSAFAKAHLSVMSHRTNDFARAFYDSMTGGTPVIAFHTVASEGTVRNGVDGLLVPLDNAIALALAIERLDQDRNLLIQMSQMARHRALFETRTTWRQYRTERIKELFIKE